MTLRLLTEVTHPRWCDRALCTALPTPRLCVFAEYGAGAFGKHCARAKDGVDVVEVTQPVAPLPVPTTLYVTVRNGTWGETVLPLGTLTRLLHEIGVPLEGAR